MKTESQVWEAPGTFEMERDRVAKKMSEAVEASKGVEQRMAKKRPAINPAALKHVRGIIEGATEAKARARRYAGFQSQDDRDDAIAEVMAEASKELPDSVRDLLRQAVVVIIADDSGDLGKAREFGREAAMDIASRVRDSFKAPDDSEAVADILADIHR